MSVASIIARIHTRRQEDQFMWSRSAVVTDQTAERRARKLNKKAVEAAPLFAHAGMVEKVTPEQVKAKLYRQVYNYADKQYHYIESLAAHAVSLVLSVANYTTEEQVDEFEAYRVRVYPPSLEYDCDYWNRKLKEVADGRFDLLCNKDEDL